MGSAHITPEQKRVYLHLRNQGLNMTQSSHKAGVSYGWAKAFEKGVRNASGADYLRQKEEQMLPLPLAYSELGDNAKRGYDDFDFFRRHYLGHVSTPWQTETALKVVDLLATPNKEYVVENVCPGVGKALALDTPLPTPTGWTTMKEVEVGDQLIDEAGRPTTVTFCSEVFYDHDCYVVSSDDGAWVIADGDHLWPVEVGGYQPKDHPGGSRGPKALSYRTKTTRQLVGAPAKRPRLTMAKAFELPEVELPIDPYVLGVWLGDGTAATGSITVGEEDVVELMANLAECGERPMAKQFPSTSAWRVTCGVDKDRCIRGHVRQTKTNCRECDRMWHLRERSGEVPPPPGPAASLQTRLREHHLLGNKHIPDAYFRASPSQRLALVQGLVDTDGYVAPNGMVEFCSTNRRLAVGVQSLVRTLGAKASLAESRAKIAGRDCGPKFRVTFFLADAARLTRKAQRCRNGVRTPARYLTVTPTDSVPTRCVMVDSPSHLYLAGEGMMVTHNTTLLHDVAAWATVRDRRIRGLFGSRAENNARRQLRRLRRTLERTTPPKARSELIPQGLALDAKGCLAVDYGTFKPLSSDIWKADEFIVAQHDDAPIEEKEPTWSCYGMDSAILGNRFELIFWDDVVDRSTIRTMDAIVNQREWFDNEGETRLEPNGVLFLVGQRMSPQDLYRYCLDKPLDADTDDEVAEAEDRGRLYTHIAYQAHYDDRCTGKHARDAKPYPEGCLLDPYRVPWGGKGGVRALQQAKPKAWRIQYQQEDVEPDDVLVKDVWISGGIDPEDGTMCPGCWDEGRDLCELPSGLVGPKISIASVDPSGKKSWALQWWVHTPASDQHFLMDLERRAMPANELLDWHVETGSFYGIMSDWQRRSIDLGLPITHWIVEVNAAQRYLLAYEHVKRFMSKHNVAIIPHTTGPRKLDADHGPWIMRDHFRFGRVRLPGKQGLMSGARRASLKLIEEVCRWPNASTTDDEVMAAWFYFLALPRMVRASEPKTGTLWTPPSWVRAS